MKEKAYFVFRPRTTDDLSLQNHNGKWMEYTVVKTICLNNIEYENFATDLLADRQFIKDNAYLCRNKCECLLIANRQKTKGILITPFRDYLICYAALRSHISLVNDIIG